MKNIFIVTLFVAITSFGCGSVPANNAVTVNVNTTQPANTDPAGTPIAGGAEDQAGTAAALVADLYKQHDAKKSPFFQTKNRALVDKYFIKPLADLIWKDATNASGEVGAIDGDPLYNAQDMEIKNFALGKAEVKGETATVPVTFANFGEKKTITFALKQVSGAWKIDNINYGGGDSLMKWLKETYPDTAKTSGTGNFEGKYIVGDTSCTVKPVKMAFEIRWAKGSGVEMFFSKGSTSFESDDKAGANRFEFDDESYNTGTFYRADGKTFAVKRAK